MLPLCSAVLFIALLRFFSLNTMSVVDPADVAQDTPAAVDNDDAEQANPRANGEQIKTFRVLLTGFGSPVNRKPNPSWLAVKALHNVTITNDQWQEVFGNIVVTAPGNAASTSTDTKAASPTTGSPPSTSKGKRPLGNGDASSGASGTTAVASTSTRPTSPPSSKSSAPASSSKAASTTEDAEDPTATTTTSATMPIPLPPLPEPGPYNIHITAIEVPMLYEEVLHVIPGLHLRPPQVPHNAPEDFPEPPEQGYDFIFHVGAAGRGSLRMEIIGHKYGYNMKDSSGAYCAVVPPISATKNLNNNRGPGAAPPAPSGPLILSGPYTGGGIHGSGFGSMGMGYNNERLGYNPAVHDPQPGIPGSETAVRPMRGFGAAYETFPDEMATDIDVTRLVQDLKASGMSSIYTSMDAGHYLCDFIYYCSLAESKRSSKALLPFLTNTPYIAPSPHYGPTYGPQAYQMQPFPGGSSNAHAGSADASSSSQKTSGPPHGNGHPQTHKPARVLLMHCPPVNEPLSTEEVTESIRRIILWVGREMEVMDMREIAAREPEEGGAPAF